MNFPPDFESKIGFDRIRERLASHCQFNLGTEETAKMEFSSDPDVIVIRLRQAREMQQILLFEEHFPSQDYYDMTAALHHIRIPGTYLEPEQFSELSLSLTTIADLLTFFEKKKEIYPQLYNLCSPSSIQHPASSIRDLASGISLIFDDKSQVRTSASPELQRIRKEIGLLRSQVEHRVVAILRTARQSGWTPDNAEVTLRDGRLVIPLQSAHKRKLSGFVHDESATGQTVYVEPAELLEMNNEIRELLLAERREIIRILIALSDEFRPHINDLTEAYHLLGYIDFTRARARLAVDIEATMPLFSPNDAKTGTPGHMRWNQARHPLLYLNHKAQKKAVVPLDLTLDAAQRILVISGPNAGGKSICLKTAGLVQYMFQCGLLPPAKEDSEFCIYDRIFLDIGDEQSLENDLSTYTSKLLNLKHFTENLDKRSLFLIDEMGAGTDPVLGGAIAEASLEAIAATGARGIVTTHYSNLKLLAGVVEGIVNGAMLFDTKNMKPLFKLRTGKPGSSFAFEIAQNVGFPGPILDRAKEKTGRSQLDFDRQLQDLEVEKEEVQKKTTELTVADGFLAEMIAKYAKKSEELEKTKKEILEKARQEALETVRNANRLVEKTIREIREAQAEKEKTKEVRKDLGALKEKLEQVGQVTGSPGQQVTGSPGKKTKNSPARQLASSSAHQLTSSPVSQSPYQSYVNELNDKLAQYQLTLDLRGKRVEEVWYILQRYIDDAILLSIPEVRILHGKGNGVLRQVTRDYLKSVKEVKKFHDEHVERGGAGITVVEFK